MQKKKKKTHIIWRIRATTGARLRYGRDIPDQELLKNYD